MKATAVALVTAFRLLSLAFAAEELALVKAGPPPFADIEVLSRTSKSNRVCVQDHSGGISIVCRGSNVLPPVRFFVNGIKVQTEGRAPFHIAGDYDIDGLTKVLKWDDFMRTPPREDGTKHMVVICEHISADGVFKKLKRTVIIEPENCKR